MSKMIATGKRRYHLSDVHHACKPQGKVHTSVLIDGFRRFREAGSWTYCTPSENMASHIARVFFRVGAATHYLLLSRGLAFPIRLFGLLEDISDAPAILRLYATQPCLFDHWSQSFMSDHNSIELLTSPDAVLLLSTVALMIITNTFNVEKMHSRNSIRSRANRNHHMHLPDLAVWQLARGCPGWCSVMKDSTCHVRRVFCSPHNPHPQPSPSGKTHVPNLANPAPRVKTRNQQEVSQAGVDFSRVVSSTPFGLFCVQVEFVCVFLKTSDANE